MVSVSHDTCSDPDIFSRGSRRPENILFLVLNLFYSLQTGFNDFITEKTILFQGSRGVQHFQGGPTFFQEGSK